ncbi:hypothetical protein V6N12_035149 [Hibiscus sabdariffa]
MMLREVEILGFVGAAEDSVLVYFLSLIAPNLDSIVINRCLPRWFRAAVVDERKIMELEGLPTICCRQINLKAPNFYYSD